MELQGTIKLINEEQQVTDSFRKREVVLDTGGDYPQEILVEFTQDKCDLLNEFAPGKEVTININVRGRKWTNPEGVDKYFNSIQGWRIVEVGEASQPVENIPVTGTQVADKPGSDLPF